MTESTENMPGTQMPPPAAGRTGVRADGSEQSLVYSKDYVDIVLAQIQRRKLSVGALYVLLFLYATAIYAPFLANDRPLFFEGVDLSSYRRAQREMALVTDALTEKVRGGEEAYRSGLAEGDLGIGWHGVLDQEVRAIESRADQMRRQLSTADRAPLDELVSGARTLADRGKEGGPVGANEGQELQALARRIQTEMGPVVSAADVIPGRTVQLVPFQSWPVLQNLSRGEVFFMVLMAMTLLFPFWNPIVNRTLGGDRFRIRAARRRKALAFLLIPVLSAVLWQGQTASFFVSTYKTGLTKNEVLAKTVIFPLVNFGIAESNSDENFRPPTWHRTSEIDKDGFYVNGPRAGRVDPTTHIPRMGKPVDIEFGEPGRNATFRHFLGTDSLGRDLLCRILWGGRVSLAVGLVGTGISVFIGIILGALAGYFGGWVDVLISRIIEIVQTFPAFFLILIIVAFIGPSILNIMVVIGLVGWTGIARLVRGEFIRLRGQEFVIASEALGVGIGRTIFRHILPNALGPVLVAATFGVASGILTESALSFLGLGIQLPVPSWGSLLIESKSAEHWWIQIYPGFLIFLTVLLYNLFGEGVRDALDPRLKVTH